ncbi:hypothetical protein PSTG_11089 [Puccinia striiformis f. sp. tritici PST-78]|uniref:MYND-type domain-containing protein n=1 Tax=Puccinia striiformis f. sp. tritici PST-78 TaxID=1165861 RepID=A0A0L0V9E0_9BASI|nr:hypothetical protein PSTG_11089 [Puccinia striiformis f. sp. tritici PST-78]
MEFLNQIDISTVALSILSLISLLVIYLQYQNVLLSPYTNLKKKTSPNSAPTSSSPPSSKEKFARCRECSKQSLISALKICSKCRISPSQQDRDPNDLNFYYCDHKCQKANWKTHKLICGNFKDLQQTTPDPSDPSNPLPPHNLLGNAFFEKRRAEVEALLKKWCEFHKNLIIFAAIHGLDLIRNPQNSKQILLMISLASTDEDGSEKFTEITDDEVKPESAAQNKNLNPEQSIHGKFSVAHVGSLDSANFFKSNPGMAGALKEIETVRQRVKEKGGIGVAILLVRCGPIVQVFPVGLPSQADLDAVPRQTNWRAIFDEAIKAGVAWKPR